MLVICCKGACVMGCVVLAMYILFLQSVLLRMQFVSLYIDVEMNVSASLFCHDL